MNPPLARAVATTAAVAAACLTGAPRCAQAQAGSAGGTAIDMQHIAVDLRFDWSKRQAIATATLTLVPLRATDTIALDAAHLRVDSVRDGEGRTLTHSDNTQPGAPLPDGALRIALGRTAPAGQPLTLTLAYRTQWVNHSDPNNIGGSNGRGLRFHLPSSTEPTRRRQIWASGEPGAVRYWLPGHDHPADLRTSELRATVAAPLQVVAGGKLVGVQHHADSTRTYHWRTDTPEPHHRTSFVVGEFTPIPQHHASVALMNQGYPDEAAGVAASVVMHADALGFLTRLIGQPFPHAGHTQVFVQDLPWNTPGSGMSVLTENFVDDHGTHLDFQYLWDGLQSESLAQQWFGGGARPLCDWHHVWVEKALAHHLAALYTEHRHGRDEYLLWYVAANQATALGDAAQGLREPVLPSRAMNADELASFASGNTPYFRGATVLHGLRELLGAARWQRTIRRFAAQPAGTPICTAGLQRAAEAEWGRSLDWYFAQWVQRSAHPVFEVSTAWRGGSGGARGGRLEITVKQMQAAAAGEAAPFYFQGPIEVQIDGAVKRVTLRPQAENRFGFKLPNAPQLVHLDPQAAWLKEVRHAKTDAELLHQLRAAPTAPLRQWAAAELMKRAQPTAAGSVERQALIGALREVIGEPRHYWRVRFLALGQLATLLTPTVVGQPASIDETTTRLLLQVIERETSWLRNAALRALGLARDPRRAELFLRYLSDDSDRVVNAAAIALGRSGSPLAFDALAALSEPAAKPSWKNQSLISALNGLAELRDLRGREIALKAFADLTSPHWTLGTAVWDHRLAATDTLVALKHTEPATTLALERFDKAMAEGEVNDIFLNLQVLATLGDTAAERVFPALKQRFATDANALKAVQTYEERFAAARRR